MDGFTATGTTINDGKTTPGDVIKDHRRSTTDAGDEVTTHAGSVRFIVKVIHDNVVYGTSFLAPA